MSILRRFTIATLIYILVVSSTTAQTTITLGVDNSTPLPGETITFTANVSGDELPPLVAFTDDKGDIFALTILSSATVQWSMSLPDTASWARTFTVFGSIENQRVASNEVTVVVQADMDKLQELSFSPAHSLVMYPGQTTKLNVVGHFSDGIDRYLNGKDMGTVYSERIVKGVLVTIGDSPTISIDEGRVQALQLGIADIVATNSGKMTVTRVRVIQANPAVDINGDGIPDTTADSDGDTISDDAEEILGTNRYHPDSDGDTTADNIEIGPSLSSPRDSNGDGQIDALDSSIRGGIPLQSEEGFYEVRGKIFDQSGTPLAQVTLQIGDQTTISDDNGYWELNDLPSGEYTVVASKSGHLFALEPLTLSGKETVIELNLQAATPNPATCQLYAVDDRNLNDSQFFTVSLDAQQQLNALGPLHQGYDIEALAIHPQTNVIYAASGNDVDSGRFKGQLYIVDGQTGALFSVGNTGFDEMGDLAFDPQGTLWAWAKGQGLVTLEVTSGAGTLIVPSDLELAGLTLSRDSGSVFYGAAHQDLWRYDIDTQALEVICSNLGGRKTEAMAMIEGEVLLFGKHQDKHLRLHAFDYNLCQIMAEASIATPQHQDIEGIAVPVAACIQ